MVEIDGSFGEGGGQCLRTALTLSLGTGIPVRVCNIRARRRKPGLRSQHLLAVRAAAAVGRAEVAGAEPGSREVTFRPGGVFPGTFSFDVGTAGSTTLVLQTVLPVLLTAHGPSVLQVTGGTHNPLAPPFDFLAKAYVPWLNRTGATVTCVLDRYGFFPGGGGGITATVSPTRSPARIEVLERGEPAGMQATILLAELPAHIAEREAGILTERLGLDPAAVRVVQPEVGDPANVLMVEAAFANVTQVFTAFGRIGLPAERVAANVVRDVCNYLRTDAPAGEHLADQLPVLMALAGGGVLRTGPLSSHARTNIEVIRAFGHVEVTVDTGAGRTTLVTVNRTGA